MAKKILVTGAGGFLGTHLLDELVKQNYNVRGLARSLKEYRKDVELMVGDIRDKDLVGEAMKTIDIVYHLAAQGNLERSIIKPYETNDTNVLGTINVLDAAVKNNIDKFIYLSTSDVYGNALTIPMKEDHPLNPKTPYAASKLSAERNCYAFNQTYNLPVVIIRSFAFFGPGQRIGKYGGVIPNFIDNMLKDDPIYVSGDGTQTRDYMYVKDVVRNLVSAMEEAPSNADPINFATESEISIRQIANMVKDITGSNSKILYKDERPGDLNRLCGSNKKAIQIMGFKIEYSFEDGLRETIDWHKSLRE